MKRYLYIYKMLLQMNFATLLAYRANFINSVISSIGWGAFSVVSILLLTSKTTSVYGWSRNELLILTSVYNIFVGIFHMLFSRNFERFSTLIDYGQLDSLLLKPLDSQFSLSLWIFNYTSIFRIIFGAALVAYFIQSLHIAVSVFSIIEFFIFGIFGIILLYSVWFMATTLLVWFPRLSNIIDLLYSINGITRYPKEMFLGIGNIVTFLLPVILVVTTPTKILFAKVEITDVVLLLFFSFCLFLVSRKFWFYALKSYTSASG